jgi:hypothetical protein
MPQHSQDLAQAAQSNEILIRHQKLGPPRSGSGTARAAVGPAQAGQGGGFGVASIPLIQKKEWSNNVT